MTQDTWQDHMTNGITWQEAETWQRQEQETRNCTSALASCIAMYYLPRRCLGLLVCYGGGYWLMHITVRGPDGVWSNV